MSVLTELIKLLIFAEREVGSCIPPLPKAGSDCWEEPQPTKKQSETCSEEGVRKLARTERMRERS